MTGPLPGPAGLLGAAPDGIGAVLDLVDGFDDALVHGLARLGEDRAAAPVALAAALAATPLGERARDAAEKIAAGSIAGDHLDVLAAARAALLGAVHDALLAELDRALERERAAWEEPHATGEAAGPGAGSRSWLHELAITGWRGVGHDLVSASAPVLDALWADPDLRRLAVLLDGLAAELRASSPITTADLVPARRWADLWTRALLLARPGGSAVPPAGEVSGRLLILCADVHEHPTAVQVQVHGVLEQPGGARPRLVRASVSAAKVDTITGPAVWQLLGDFPVLLGALAGHVSLEIDGMPMLAGGDLLWREDRARPGEPADPFVTARLALPAALAPPTPPLERHPARIAEPVLLEGYTTSRDGDAVTFHFDGAGLPVAVDRLPACGPVTPELVAASSTCLGLLRWDGGWSIQPTGVQATVRRKPVTAHTGDWALGPAGQKAAKAQAAGSDAVAVLKERAGRLLRS